MAVELFPSVTGDPPEKHSKMTDIWAFGMVAYEMISWNFPYKDMLNDVSVMINNNCYSSEAMIARAEECETTIGGIYACVADIRKRE